MNTDSSMHCAHMQIFPPNAHSFVFLHFQALRQSLDSGKSLAFPDGLLINGQAHTTINGDQGEFCEKGYSSTFSKFQLIQSTSLKLLFQATFMLSFLLYFQGRPT